MRRIRRNRRRRRRKKRRRRMCFGVCKWIQITYSTLSGG
jgi:hypothetical protein